MGLKCFLCKCRSDKANKISLYSFPNCDKYPHIYKEWLVACNLNEEVDVRRFRICSGHFREQDKIPDYAIPRIKSEATPTINVKTPITVVEKKEENSNEVPTPPPYDTTMNPAPMENIYVTSHSENSTVNENITPKRELDAAENSSSSESETPKKRRRFFHPRSISEVNLTDFASPQSASRTLKFLKQKNMDKTRKIKSLQTAKRRLQKRVTLLEDLLSDIKK